MYRKSFFFLAILLIFSLSACAITQPVVTQNKKDPIGEVIDKWQKEKQAVPQEVKVKKANGFRSEKNQDGSKDTIFIYKFISNVSPDILCTYWWSPQVKTDRILDYIEMRHQPLNNDRWKYKIIANCNGISSIIRRESQVAIPGDDLIPFNIDIGFENEVGPQTVTIMVHPQVGLWEKSKH